MRTASAAALLLLLQTAPRTAPPSSQLAAMRLERAVVPASSAAGPTCAVLDAAVFAHMDARSGADLRLFARHNQAASAWIPKPFVLTESSAAAEQPDIAVLRAATLHSNRLAFDLTMPTRPYSEVDLSLNEKNFIALALVTGERNQSPPQSLGAFTLFDLSAQGLARSTALTLAETSFPRLHISLRFFRPDGTPLALSSNPVTGALVPPSREAQTLYTTIASTHSFAQSGANTIAHLEIPAHVPVERIVATLAPGFHGSFLRTATLVADAQPQPSSPTSQQSLRETLSGSLWRVQRPAHAGAPAIDAAHLAFDAVLGVNLRAPARVTLSIANGAQPPLPLQSIALQMRQRQLCFNATPGTSYLLAYGDPALRENALNLTLDGVTANLAAPLNGTFHPGSFPQHALLGPELRNPHFVPPPPPAAHHMRLRLGIMLAILAVLLLALSGSSPEPRKRSREPGKR